MEATCDRKMFGRAVDELMDELTNTLHTVVRDLMLKLHSEFTELERQKIDGRETDMERVTTLFTTLKTKPVDTYQKCLKALEELKHHDVADKLRDKMKSSCSPVAGNEILNSGGGGMYI